MRLTWGLLILVAALAVGCGESEDDKAADTGGPVFGDQCRVTAASGAEVEVNTVTGPLTCEEAESVLGAYYSNLENAEGSGGGLTVESWECISAPAAAAPDAGGCVEPETGREFELIAVSDPKPVAAPKGEGSGGGNGKPPGKNKPSDSVTAQLDYDSPISTEGLGPILVGMSEREAERAGGVKLAFDGGIEPACDYAHASSLPDTVAFMFVNGQVARVDVNTPKIAALSGIRVGDSEAEVLSEYGDRIERTPHQYYENGSYLTYVPERDDNTRVIFHTDGSAVTAIIAGRLPEVAYVEGCA